MKTLENLWRQPKKSKNLYKYIWDDTKFTSVEFYVWIFWFGQKLEHGKFCLKNAAVLNIFLSHLKYGGKYLIPGKKQPYSNKIRLVQRLDLKNLEEQTLNRGFLRKIIS